jgi:lipid-A-disaccharide synthase
MARTLFLSACEVSGDRHGAALATALLRQDPSIRLIGLGGQAMRQAGVEVLWDITATSTIGLIEPLRFLPRILCAFFHVKSYLNTHHVDDFVAIDAQGFHMMLLPFVHRKGIRTHYYIASQEWQWGTPEGGKKVVAVVDQILAIFKPEADFYQKLGGEVTLVGHPLMETTKRVISREAFCAQYQLDIHRPIVGVFVGSRRQELKLAAPDILRAAQYVHQNRPDVQILVSCAAPHIEPEIINITKQLGLDYQIVSGSLPLMSVEDVALTVSGTITLEHAILGVPAVVGYRFGALSYWIATTFFAKKVARIPFMALPNLILNRLVYPEFFQSGLDPVKMGQAVLDLLDSASNASEKMRQDLLEIADVLGESGAVTRAAEAVLRSV